MVRILIVLTLLTFLRPSLADVVIVGKTEEGGEIVLLGKPCGTRVNFKKMYLRAKGGRVYNGCYTYSKGLVIVDYEDGVRYAYDADQFVIAQRVD